jgi:hypothetical protein
MIKEIMGPYEEPELQSLKFQQGEVALQSSTNNL